MKVLIFLALVSYAVAQTTSTGQSFEEVFQQLNVNHNNQLEKSEIRDYLDQLDPNHDCIVTSEEFSSRADPADRHSPEIVGPFNYYDKLDGTVDNRITCSIVDAFFNKLDVNHDGQVTRHEFLSAFPAIETELQAAIAAARSAPVGK